MKSLFHAAVAATLLGLVSTACTVHQAEQPSLTGPSEFALSITMNAIPDAISQDGGSQSAIKIIAKGPDGQPKTALPIRVDMEVNGVLVDFGSLSARSIVTGSDGVATVIYTAPSQNPSNVTPTCAGVPGQCVTIIATPTGTDFQTANSQIVVIRLVPPGVILPPAGTPTASFTITPSTVVVNIASTFDASASTPGTGATQITSYSWMFGDGGTAIGKTVDHRYDFAGSFDVTLTVTNDRNVAASSVRTVSVATSKAPEGDWVHSPSDPIINDVVIFNATPVLAAAGRNIVSYAWNFGDGGTSNQGPITTHSFTAQNTYQVVLTVTDDAGQRLVLPQDLKISGLAAPPAPPTPPTPPVPPVADFEFSPAAPHAGDVVSFVSTSTTPSRAAIVSYSWNFGDTSTCPSNCGTGSASAPTHVFLAGAVGTRTVSVILTVTDSSGLTSTAKVKPVTVTTP